MSKIGQLPVKLPEGVTAEITGEVFMVKGPLGEGKRIIPGMIKIAQENGFLQLSLKKQNIKDFPVFGTTRALVANMVTGVSKGWAKTLELVGAGYRAEVNGKDLILTVGYSHPVKITAPEGISFKVEKNLITVGGIDKETVGQLSAQIRAVRKPEPYKGKGIKYQDEIIRRKAGKAAKTVGAPA